VPAAELLMVSYGARQHLRRNRQQQQHHENTLTRRFGSFTLEESLARLVKDGLIERAEAVSRAVHVEELEAML
jgi:Tfp pilus assembly pilus retraction ATPase PilT